MCSAATAAIIIRLQHSGQLLSVSTRWCYFWYGARLDRFKLWWLLDFNCSRWGSFKALRATAAICRAIIHRGTILKASWGDLVGVERGWCRILASFYLSCGDHCWPWSLLVFLQGLHIFLILLVREGLLLIVVKIGHNLAIIILRVPSGWFL